MLAYIEIGTTITVYGCVVAGKIHCIACSFCLCLLVYIASAVVASSLGNTYTNNAYWNDSCEADYFWETIGWNVGARLLTFSGIWYVHNLTIFRLLCCFTQRTLLSQSIDEYYGAMTATSVSLYNGAMSLCGVSLYNFCIHYLDCILE